MAGADHPLVQKKKVTSKMLAKECWILREKGSATRTHLEQWFKDQEHSLVRTVVLNSPEAVKRLVEANLGVAFTSQFAVQDELKRGRLKRLAVEGLCLRRALLLVQHVDKCVTPPMETFLDMIFRMFPC